MKPGRYRIYAHSENSLTIQLEQVISENQIHYLYHLKNTIHAQEWPWVLDILVTFHELTLLFDHTTISVEEMKEYIHGLVEDNQNNGHREVEKVNHFIIPVCYEDEWASDKIRLEKHTGLPFSEIVNLHTQGDYILYMVGFLPGFMYLGGLNKLISCPRLENPRSKILPGSIGIAGEQTGVYPMASPGGWNIIGRTPLSMFDYHVTEPDKNSPTGEVGSSKIRPLDRIRFISITRHQFEKLQGMSIKDYQLTQPKNR